MAPVFLSSPGDIDPSLSHALGPTDTHLLDETIGQNLARTVAAFPDKDALIDLYGDIHLSYQELHRKVLKLASGLHNAGYRRGDRIGVWSPNRWEWVILQFATAEIGAILVCINPTYRARELTYAVNQSGVKGLFSAGRFKDSNYRAMVGTVEHTFDRPYKETIFFGSERWEELAGHAVLDLKAVRDSLDPHDPINIQYTSGTTGMAKGATLTHHNILNNGYLIGERLSYTENDRVVVPVPMFHCFGMVLGVLAAFTHGAAVIFPGPVFTPESTLEAVHLGQGTSLLGVPTMFMAELRALEQLKEKGKEFDLSGLRTGIMAGTSCPTTTMREVIDVLGITEISICYGMTETSPVNHQTLPDDPVEKRVETVGRVGPHLEVKVVDLDGATVQRGVQGELLVRGYSVMRGYWDMPEKTAEAVDPEGWMHSGDLGVMDTEGYVQVTGRIKDMVIRGGENIYPREIEEFLYEHPDIADVQVIGVPDEKYGEELMAWVIMDDGKEPLTVEDIRSYCDGQLARFKVPRYVHVTDAFPMTLSGKVRKVEMREKSISILGIYEKSSPRR
ncbi:MAG: AMP-binding protein [Corynebacterium sp.]|uniref:AMP-binding protein n=3 Tax=Corynebacterium TaxID=1716 RepID=UPI0026479EFB|nr:AMP-binding protein [Corynebacterium sp.]MDN5581252.1 AMP-binding protein [Corynebacterium sp.]MDN5719715.1 AMP-binding protein [Corynebacterium sp.]MDN6324246.1 AMP-binding protein [Corynebacterium sp.]MDN6386678.1 AMP-binding protein [Corynebacterium sp.]